MKAVGGEAPRGDGWVYELKWDGMRLIAFISENGVRLQSSNGHDVTNSFPELAALSDLADNLDGLVLDGEAVAFADGRPSFNALQRRMHVTDGAEAARRSNDTPVLFVVFDMLRLGDHDTMALPLVDRRKLLEQIVIDDSRWSLCPQYGDNLDELLAAVKSAGLEGIVAKRSTSRYQPGRRSSDWVKVKPRRRQEFVVGGWLAGQGARSGSLGSLIVGYYDDGDNLRFAGRAGSGLDAASIEEWQATLTAREACPFVEPPALPKERAVTWCEPDQVAEIAFGEWSDQGQLRHPVVLGRRGDKDPRTVVREP